MYISSRLQEDHRVSYSLGLNIATIIKFASQFNALHNRTNCRIESRTNAMLAKGGVAVVKHLSEQIADA